MGYERSPKFLLKTILFNFVFLGQLCTEAAYIAAEGPSASEGYYAAQVDAEGPSPFTVTPSPSPAPQYGPSNNCGGLNCAEASILRYVINYLRPANESLATSVSCPADRGSPIWCSCDSSPGPCFITKIKLRSSMLTGSISYQINSLPNLTEIVLSSNQLVGSIPYSLGYLPNLRILDLSGNQLTGYVPASLQNLQSLRMLDLSSNQLTGPIPENLTNLQDLRELYLSNNKFNGKIPENMTGLQSLQYLDLSWNQFTGPIPESLTDCHSLSYIWLRYNFLSGSLPKNLEALSSLTYLNLFSNSLSGPLANLGKLSELVNLYLEENKFDGDLPKELGALTNLKYLSLLSNNFSGKIPDEYHQLTGLRSFGLGGNSLSGRVPDYIASWHNLTHLNLLGNNFEGDLPAEIFNLPNLEELWVSDISKPGIALPKQANLRSVTSVILRNCSISGPIPEYIGEWPQLKYLDLSFNNLVHGIPDSLRKLDNLILTRNMLNGTPPKWITEDILLHVLAVDVSYNNFSLPCPEENCSSKYVVKIHPSRSFISGMKEKKCDQKHRSLFINCGGEKEEIGKHRYHNDTATSNFVLSSSDHWAYSFSGNYFENTAQTYVKNLTCDLSAPETNLYSNFRIAPVSLTYYGLCLHKGEYNVRLHFTESVYSKHVDYSISGKRVFDVYSQGLRQLKDFNIKEKTVQPNKEWNESFSAKVHDDGVLEVHLFWAGKGSLYNPPMLNGPVISAISITQVPRKLSASEIVGITVACTLFLLLLFTFMWWMGWIGDRELHRTKIKIGKGTFTLKQIIDATGKFSSSMEIGRGRSGIVYTARMKANHQKLPTLIVAVKKLFFQSKAADEVVAEQPEQTVAVKNEESKAADEVVAEQPEQTLTVKNEESKAADEVVTEQPELTLAVKKLFSLSKAVEVAQPVQNVNVEQPKFIVAVKKLFSRLKAALTAAEKKLFSQSKAEVPQPTVEVSQNADEIASEVYAKKGLALKHDNLVQLLAIYSKHHLHLLIYEYMEHGSLGKALFESDAQLRWQTRFHICRGIAKGLKYLHERNSPIIHRNIKATNILLDAIYNPKISDLGLAKLYEEENPEFLIGAEGDLLYMAPEYATRRAMTVKVDVYSFGILLLEIVSGRNNAEYKENQETVFLLDTACNLHAKGNLGELVDERSRPYDWDQANKVLNLAIMCINQTPSLRPTMSQVVSVLEGEKSLQEISVEITPHDAKADIQESK